MKRTIRVALTAGMCVAAGFIGLGCTVLPAERADVEVPGAAGELPTLSLTYEDSVQSVLADMNLKTSFEAYWRTHFSRNWARLFTMEHASVPLSEKFYVPYHARAWPVLEVKVLSFARDGVDGDVVLNLQVVYENPDNAKPHKAYRQDQWRLVDGVWRHVVIDPMLIQVK